MAAPAGTCVTAQRSSTTVAGDQRDRAAGPLRSAVVVNPARTRNLARRRRVVEDELARAGWPAPAWFETTPDDPGAGQAHAAVAGGAEIVFVCGGDGTVRSCLSALAGTDAALAVLPVVIVIWFLQRHWFRG